MGMGFTKIMRDTSLTTAVSLGLAVSLSIACSAKITATATNNRSSAPQPAAETPSTAADDDAGKAAPPAPAPAEVVSTATPIEIPDGFSATRRFYQTRSVITLNIKATAVVSGDLISLHNDTTGLDLFDHQPLAFGLTADDPVDVLSLDGAPYDIQVRLYPAASTFAGRFAYDINKLRLVVDDKVQPKFSQSQIYLKDFPYFSAGSTNFSGSDQRTDGLQGSVSRLVSPSVTNGVAILATGMLNILNR